MKRELIASILLTGLVLAGNAQTHTRKRHAKPAAAPVQAAASSSETSAQSPAAPGTQALAPVTSDAKPVVLVPTGPSTTQFDPVNGFPDRNGDLSAMLIVIPQQELEVFSKPADERHLDRVSRAEAGAQLALKIVFAGAQPDPQGIGHVTYDLTVTGPDGKVYGAPYKGLEALRGQIGAGHGVYDNRLQVVTLQFEPKDLPGIYTISAVVHDITGARDVATKSSVELLAPGAQPATAPGPIPAPAAAASASSDAASPTTPATKTAKHRRRHR